LRRAWGLNFTVYEYDRCGRDDSDDRAPYSIEREVEDLAAVVQAAGGSAFVFGHSSGGALALEAAARSVAVRRLVVYEPPYTDGPTAEFAEQLAELIADGRRADAAERYLALLGTPPEVLNQMKAGPYWAHLQSLAHTLPYDIRLCNDGMVPLDRLAKITARTLALAGGASLDWAREVARVIDDPSRR
jgi:pimeloyl-ACP methyl ester carboxylesterase